MQIKEQEHQINKKIIHGIIYPPQRTKYLKGLQVVKMKRLQYKKLTMLAYDFMEVREKTKKG